MDSENTKAMILYESWLDAAELLTDDEELEYYRAIFAYGFSGELPDDLTSGVRMAMRFVTSAIDRNKEKRERIIERRREAGRNHSGNQYTRAKEALEQNGTNGTSVPKMEQNGTNGTINVNDNVNVNGNVNVLYKCNNEKKEREIEKKKTLSLTEVLSYGEEKGFDSDVVTKFFNMFAPDWVDVNGMPIKNWKIKLNSFVSNERGGVKSRRSQAREQKYDEVKVDINTSKTTGKKSLEIYKSELKKAFDGDENMRVKHVEWERLCKQYNIS